ncbi:flavodoxin family protein [Ligilactobacillus faecis]|uniref:flavodoxin family protein n=1 Tax=Ligilactobacillus faecis TaxID=762833 RepID=UPI002468D6C7|nr:NAD(P)H-dependent oxidoreductase [Ligilactobacillus faecis]WGN88805.1 NAD(P)H-dependent oxidoreductase [Ligilactobacillus faecis]
MSWLKKNDLLDGKIVFVNASEHAQGNTHRIGQRLLSGKDFSQLDLVNYKIYQIGQNYADDQFNEVLAKLKEADTIILGTPVYWHAMSGYLKVLLERLSQQADPTALAGKKVAVFVQGAAPSDTIKPTKAIVKRFAKVAQMQYIEMGDF